MTQDYIVIAIVLLALAYLVRRWWRRAKSTTVCGENCCCSANKTVPGKVPPHISGAARKVLFRDL